MEMPEIVSRIILCLFLFHACVRANVTFHASSCIVYVQNSAGETDVKSSESPTFFQDRAVVCWENTGTGVVAPDWSSSYACGDYFAAAGQEARFETGRIAVRGLAEEWNPFFHALTDPFTQSAWAVFEATFILDAPAEIAFTASLEVWGDYGGTDYGLYKVYGSLGNQAENLWSADIDSVRDYDDWMDGASVFEQTFFLEPGLYTLEFGADAAGGYYPYWPYGYDGLAWGIGGGGYASYEMEMTWNTLPAPIVPAPGSVTLAFVALGLLAGHRKVL